MPAFHMETKFCKNMPAFHMETRVAWSVTAVAAPAWP